MNCSLEHEPEMRFLVERYGPSLRLFGSVSASRFEQVGVVRFGNAGGGLSLRFWGDGNAGACFVLAGRAS